MRKIILGVLCTLMVFVLTSCALFAGPNTNTVYVKSDGTVIGTHVETFDEENYDKDELETFIKDAIDEYKKTTGKETIELKSFKVKEKSAKAEIQYDSAEDYMNFNQVEFFAGTIKEALKAGYSFDEEFLEVVDGEVGEAVNTAEIKEDEKLKVIITEEVGDVKTSGDIMFVGSIHAQIKEKNLVSITEVDESDIDDKEKVLTYIIYK